MSKKTKGKHARGAEKPGAENTEQNTQASTQGDKTPDKPLAEQSETEAIPTLEQVLEMPLEPSDDDGAHDAPQPHQPGAYPNSAPAPAGAPMPYGAYGAGGTGLPMDDDMAELHAFVSAADMPRRKKHGALKAFGITCGVLIGVLLVAYIVGAVVFMGRFLPNTVIGSHDVSMKTDDEVIRIFDDAVESYQLDIVGTGFSYRTTGPQIGMGIDSKALVQAAHEDLNPWKWPLLIAQPEHDESSLIEVTYDKAAFSKDLAEKVTSFNAGATPPVNATIVYDEPKKQFTVKPEEKGTQLNADSIVAATEEILPTLQEKLTLTDKELVQPTVLSTDQKLIDSAQIATGMVSADLKLKMAGQDVGEVNGIDLAEFVSVNENMEVVFNEDGLNQWVAEVADSYNTIETERTYTRPDGKQITVSGGSYGWEVDTEALSSAILEGVKAGAKMDLDIPLLSAAEVYNGRGQPDWRNRYIDVDLSEQYVRFYDENSQIIWESACITGSPDGEHDTVPGVWYINNKESPSKLIGYERGVKIYETMVTYWMAFERSDIGFHDATWQPSFGGSMYASGYGSHGCVNLPYGAAQELYGLCQVEDVVIVHF